MAIINSEGKNPASSDAGSKGGKSGPGFALTWAMPPLVWQAAFFLGPLIVLVAMSFWSIQNFRLTPDFVSANWVHIYSARFFSSAYIYTFNLAVIAAVTASLLALPVSYTLAFKIAPHYRRLLILLLIVPFFTSYPVRTYSWQIFFSPQGILNTLIAPLGLGPVQILNSARGTLVGYLTLTMPLVILIQTFALSNVDRRLIEAAYNLHCSRGRTIFTVILPSARTGLILAGTLAFVLSFGDYIAPMLLGGSRPPTLSILIADQVKSGNHWPRASVIAVTMMGTLLVTILIMLGLAYGKRKGR